VWDTATDTIKRRLNERNQDTFGLQWLAFSANGRYLDTPNGSHVEIWDVAEFK